MTALERLAKVLWRPISKCDLRNVSEGPCSLGVECPCWPLTLERARQALAAIRVPTEAMVKAAEDGDDPGSSIYGDPFEPLSHEDAWTAMIDAILEEKP